MSQDKPYCIVTDDNVVLVKDLNLNEAENQLCKLLNYGWDCYIGETIGYLVDGKEPTPFIG